MIQIITEWRESIALGYNQGSSFKGRNERKSVRKNYERTVLEMNIEEVK